jgi:mono/diheme cytochrome c family protein
MEATMMDFSLLFPVLTAAFGGWASVTVEDVPDYLVAGQPVTLNYTVRAHGKEPVSGLNASIDVRSGDQTMTIPVTAGAKAGRYTATLTPSRTGDWTIVINTGFWPKKVTLLPITAIAAGARAPVLADAQRGQRLFAAKGCTTCHTHRAVPAEGMQGAIDLTERRFSGDALAQFLSDPPKALKARGSDRFMPNLELKPKEIASLVAFINQDGGTAGR